MAEEIVLAEYPDAQKGSRWVLPPLPMIRKSTHTPMPDTMVSTMPNQAEIARLEQRAQEHRRKMHREA